MPEVGATHAPLSEQTCPPSQPAMGLHAAVQVPLPQESPVVQSLSPLHFLLHSTPKASPQAKVAPAEPPQLATAQAAKRDAAATLAAAVSMRAVEVAEDCLGRRM